MSLFLLWVSVVWHIEKSSFESNFYSFIEPLPKFCRLGDDLLFSIYAHYKGIRIIQNAQGSYGISKTIYPQHNYLEIGHQPDALSKGADGFGDNLQNYSRCMVHLHKTSPSLVQPIIDKGNSLKEIKNFISYFLADTSID